MPPMVNVSLTLAALATLAVSVVADVTAETITPADVGKAVALTRGEPTVIPAVLVTVTFVSALVAVAESEVMLHGIVNLR